MKKWYITRDEDYLRHASNKQSNKKFKPKYYYKLDLGGKKYRYFYSKEEYDSWKNNDKPNNNNKDKRQLLDTIRNSFGSNTILTNNILIKRNVAKLLLQQPKITDVNEEILLDKDSLPAKDKPMSKEEDQAAVNPNYDPTIYEYSNNCSYCTATYDLRQRGYDVEAAAYGDEYDGTNTEIESWYIDSPEFKEVDVNFLMPETSAKEIEKLLLEYGEGAMGHFGLYWIFGSAHSVVWEVKNNEVVIRDCQTNETYDVRYYMDYVYKIDYLRTDNLEVSENILEVVADKNKRKR